MKSLEELKVIRDRMQSQIGPRCGVGETAPEHVEGDGPEKFIMVCGGTGCHSGHSQEVMDRFEKLIKVAGKEKEYKVIQTGCQGLCAKGPIVVIHPGAVFYEEVNPDKADVIFREHVEGGNVASKYLLREENADGTNDEDFKFYNRQTRIALRNCGMIDPENIDEYIGRGGYEALGRSLTQMSPDDVIQVVLDSGLRGRGGAGFPTGKKWIFACGYRGEVLKYVCCNADEGDPGAFMDRSILEGDPHSVLEAMAIAGYAIGAEQVYIYVRAEYPIAVDRLRIAIRQAREYGLLGKNLFGTDFNFDIDLRLGAGAFVCGEETALMTSIEGNRGEPHTRPPFPAVKGLFQSPPDLNNVETYANVPKIIVQGADWFRTIGTEGSPGTKTFSLTGAIENTGLIEVPMGTTLREIIYDIGGGIKGDAKFKAVQIGGPSGGCLITPHLDVSLDFDSLKKMGAMIGSGGLVVMDDKTCMVEVARFFMNFTQNESCGKCVPCREGTKRMLEILERIVAGKGTREDLDLLDELASTITDTALCGLGKSAALPVMSTLRLFRKEYEEHVVDKKCAAKNCTALRRFVISPERCKGCSKCARNCPVGAISGQIKKPYVIDDSICIKCGACESACAFHAIHIEA